MFQNKIVILRYINKVMGISKTDLFTTRQNRLSAWAKVLGHPARLAIIEHLLEKDACTCGPLVLELGLAQSTVSQHLKELKLAGLIKGSVEGTSMCYCIDGETWQQFTQDLTALFKSYTPPNNCC